MIFGSLFIIKEVPADCILLTASNERKNCYVQTANLDGYALSNFLIVLVRRI